MNRNKVVKNASWLIGIQLVKSLLAMVISMLTARFLGPSGFGLINYAASIVSFVAPIMYLGLTGVLVQELVTHPEREGEILGTSIFLTLFSSLFCIGGVAAFVSIANFGERDTFLVCLLYSTLLIFQSLEIMIYWFQAKLLSKYSSMVALFAYLIVSGYKIFLLATGKSVYWFAVSNALDYMVIAICLFFVYRRMGGARLRFSTETAKKLLKKSRYYIIPDMMVAIFAQTDRIMLKLMIDDAATGYYSAAVTCAGMTAFVFSAVIDSFRPMIFDDKKNNEEQYEKDVCRLYSVIIYLSLLQSVFITAFAGLIIRILYGVDYAPSVSALRLIVWYTTFSYVGAVRNIWILAEGKQKYLWVINLAGAAANVVLNYFLIPVMGIMGAALASLITQIFTNVIVGFILKPIRYNNRLMIKALNPADCVRAVKALLAKRKQTGH